MKQHWHSLNHWLEQGAPKRDYFACFILGLLSALAMPPLYALPVLFLTFPVFYPLLNKSLTTRQAAVKTWLFHFGYYTAGFYWIAWALLVDFTHNWWAIPFAVFGLPALMSFYPALLTAVWHRLAWRGTARLLLFVVFLGVSEWLRGVCFTGFPWNLWGYAWVAFLPMLQSVSVIGMYGLSFMTVLLALCPTLWLQRRTHAFSRTLLLLTLAIFAVFLSWGLGRVSQPLKNSGKDFIVRIVQPNIPQSAKWDPEARFLHEEKLWRLTTQKATLAPGMIIWPETAVTLLDTLDVRRLAGNLRNLLPRGSYLATGVLDVDLDDITRTRRYFNRIGIYDDAGHRLFSYDKTHLVPFGEFLPYQQYWPVKPVAFSDGQFTPGNGPQKFRLPDAPSFTPLVCYEVLFPGAVLPRDARPQFILNVTNDGWYGNTTGPFQHLALAQSRAVEEGVPLARSANTGISAMIDPMGHIIARLDLNTSGVLDLPLPPSLTSTLFSRFGNAVFFMLLALFGALAFIMQSLQARKIQQLS